MVNYVTHMTDYVHACVFFGYVMLLYVCVQFCTSGLERVVSSPYLCMYPYCNDVRVTVRVSLRVFKVTA